MRFPDRHVKQDPISSQSVLALLAQHICCGICVLCELVAWCMRYKGSSYHGHGTKTLHRHWCSVSTERSEPCSCVITGAGSPHKPHLCECVPPPPCWSCTGGMGCSQRPQTTQGVGGLAGLCHLWPSGWHCIPGNTQAILSGFAHYSMLHSP